MIPLVQIEVTPDIAYKIRRLAEAGVFAINTGNVELNFHEGNLKIIKAELITHVASYPHVPPIASIDTHDNLMKSV